MGNFEFDGAKYRNASAHQKEWGTKVMAGLSLSGVESILDLGCGDGQLTKQLAGLVPRGKVLGIDASLGMIGTAKELEGPNLSFVHLDIDRMQFNHAFDLIFSNAALHWVKDHQLLLGNCKRALKPNGLIRFNFAGDGNCSNFYEVIRRIMNRTEFKSYFQDFAWPWFMPEICVYEKLVNRHGFSNIKVWKENADRYFTREELIRWIDQPSIVPFLTVIPDKKKGFFRDEVVQTMMEKTRQPDGTCFETFRRINVYAKNTL